MKKAIEKDQEQEKPWKDGRKEVAKRIKQRWMTGKKEGRTKRRKGDRKIKKSG